MIYLIDRKIFSSIHKVAAVMQLWNYLVGWLHKLFSALFYNILVVIFIKSSWFFCYFIQRKSEDFNRFYLFCFRRNQPNLGAPNVWSSRSQFFQTSLDINFWAKL
jgi:hypothetical protein